ncbi:MAG: MFS transporter, partial [Alphaproteobacteria bacterium]
MSKTEASGLSRRPILAIAGAAVGTLLVWYDFFLFVSLGGLIGAKFLPAGNGADGYVFALLAVAAGLVMRPVGALVFGRLADGKGRKPALLTSILLMAAATLIVALLPTRAQIGVAAPTLLIALRLLQGLALGGEPVAAAIYAAELAPAGKRGLWTGAIQMAGTLGLALALGAALSLKGMLGEAGFESWGWRIPFALSAVLIGVWAWLRLALAESAVVETVGENRKPIAEALASPANLKRVGLALLGLAAGQAIVWQTGQLYVLSFLQSVLHVDATVAEGLMLPALLAGAPFFVLFGWLSDKVGRKPLLLIVTAGMAITLATMAFIFGTA